MTEALSIEKIKTDIQEECGLDPDDLPRTDACKWFALRAITEAAVALSYLEARQQAATTDEEKGAIEAEKSAMWESATIAVVIRRGQPFPLPSKDRLVALEVFEDDAEIRVYVYPEKLDNARFARYRMSKTVPNYSMQSMPVDIWTSQIAEELVALDNDVNAAENEREAIIDYLTSKPKDYPMSDAIDDIAEELHLVPTEEPEEDGDGEDDEGDGEEDDADGGDDVVAKANGPTTTSTGAAIEPSAAATPVI